MKYILHHGYVISKNDGDRHYISATQLADLYGVPIGSSIVAGSPAENARGQRAEDIHLYPRQDGDYTLPTHCQ